ncbi:receptor-type tyrosine-protein phosphatase T-like isoform X6 [Tachypleus tridentatus]|uniref:receptor-type tyrosine-protein phosphatase T-like isoform X6 n=1 Tax=Tachypleus tridentatus TaxID=6853 RepID=UPI003FD4B801
MEKEPSNNLDVLRDEASALEIHQYESPPGAEKQHVIKLEDLEEYVKTMTENEGFAEQYNMLKTGQLKDWTVGMKPENKNKNRYSTLLPYDETRVVLNPLKNDPHSDYINANYIDGYNTSRAYICTQGPLEKTVADFWRLIWQEEVCKIVMTCNIVENCKMVKAESKVDVLGLLKILRGQRVNLVETVEQYAFVHHALTEVLFGDNPCRQAEEFPLYFKNLTKIDCQTETTGMQTQFERLERETAKFRESRANTNTLTERKAKNRVADVLAFDCASTSNNHLNTVYVHGYGVKEALITIECPSPFATNDFWQLVHESACQTLVLLNGVSLSDKCCSTFWPESGSRYYGNLKVDHVGTEQTQHLIIRNLKLKNPVEDHKSRLIKQFHLSGWQKEDTIPPSAEAIITLLQVVERWQHKTKSKPTIVVCRDGVSASGIFCAASFLFRQKQLEKEMDVYEAVRTIRTNEPNFIRSVDQYRWVYEVACGFGRFKTPSD